MTFRRLKPNEVSCKVKQVTERGDKISALVLLYKDARVDMAILDETFTPLGWQNEYSVIKDNLFCTVSVFDNVKGMWVSKSNVGTESDTEAEKGEASDAFKRACTNWGIGRELYTAPAIWIKLNDTETYKSKNGNIGCKARFEVSDIAYSEDGDINYLVVTDGNQTRFSFNIQGKQPPLVKPRKEEPIKVEPIKVEKPEIKQIGWIAKSVYNSKDGYKHLCTLAPLETVRAELLKAGATGWENIDYDQYSMVFITLNSAPEKFRDDTENAKK